MEDRGRQPSGWKPLLSGHRRGLALDRIESIARQLLALDSRNSFEDDPSLATGLAGVAIFFNYLPTELQHLRGPERAGEMIARAVRHSALPSLGCGLFEGASGVAWAFSHLSQRSHSLGETDPLLSFDESLLHIIENFQVQSYDLMDGLVGIGVYGLDRRHSPFADRCVSTVIGRLCDWAEANDHGIAWPTADPSLPPDPDRLRFDLGIAHGLAGVIAFLARAISSAVGCDRSEELLSAAVSCLLRQERTNVSGPRFPYTVDLCAAVDTRPPRAAWCYGDPGTAVALLSAGNALDICEWSDRALALARHAACLRVDATGVEDAGFCHGAAGLAHIFNRMWQASGDTVLQDAAARWYGTVLDMWQKGEAVAGYPAKLPSPEGGMEWWPEAGLLQGAAGIGLALSAAIGGEAVWDTIFLTSPVPTCGSRR